MILNTLKSNNISVDRLLTDKKREIEMKKGDRPHYLFLKH